MDDRTSQTGIFLARHGRTAYNHEGRFQGRLPVPLDETGVHQAHELAERAAERGFSVLYASTLLRAQETAQIVGQRLGLEPIDEPRLVETDAGDWTDRPFSEVRAEAPELFDAFVAGDPAFAFPGGESFAEQEQRVLAALAGRGAPPEEFTRVPNAAIVPLDPRAAELGALGGGDATPAS